MAKIEVKNNEIKDQDALKYKNFDQVVDKYSKLKKTFNWTSYLSVGAVFLLATSAYLFYNLSQENLGKTMENLSYQSVYNSPIEEGIDFEVIAKVIEKNTSLTITTKSGTKITIPENTLVDSLGVEITGNVFFKYREFLDQKDVFLSGISMNYDSATTKRNFESGGMFELLAYQDNHPIFINPSKKIQIDLATKQSGDNFNIYYFSPNENRWIYKGKDSSGFNQKERLLVDQILENDNTYKKIVELDGEKENQQIKLEALKKTKPIKPVLSNIDRYSFTINVSSKDFPELVFFKGLRFQVSDKDRNFKPAYAEEKWDDVNVTKGSNRLEYQTCFENKRNGEICFLTNPVFNKTDIKGAELLYNELLKKYKSKKDSLKSRYKEIKEQIAEQSAKLNSQRIIELNKRVSNLGVLVENKVTRTFQIARFGVWNSDCPQRLPNEAIVKADFVDEDGNDIKMNTMYLVLKDRNEVISITLQTIKEGVRYNPEESCMLWAVTNDKKNVAIFSSDRFKEIRASDKTFTFEMDLISSKEFVTYSIEKIFSL